MTKKPNAEENLILYLITTNDYAALVKALGRHTPEYFTGKAATIVAEYARGKFAWNEAATKLDSATLAYVQSLLNNEIDIPVNGGVAKACDELRDEYIGRLYKAAHTKYSSNVADGMPRIEAGVLFQRELAQINLRETRRRTGSDPYAAAMIRIRDAAESGGRNSYLKLPFSRWPLFRTLQNGIWRGTCSIIGGLEGAGKTTLMLQFARDVLAETGDEKDWIAFINLEQPAPHIVERNAYAVAGTSFVQLAAQKELDALYASMAGTSEMAWPEPVKEAARRLRNRLPDEGALGRAVDAVDAAAHNSQIAYLVDGQSRMTTDEIAVMLYRESMARGREPLLIIGDHVWRVDLPSHIESNPADATRRVYEEMNNLLAADFQNSAFVWAQHLNRDAMQSNFGSKELHFSTRHLGYGGAQEVHQAFILATATQFKKAYGITKSDIKQLEETHDSPQAEIERRRRRAGLYIVKSRSGAMGIDIALDYDGAAGTYSETGILNHG